MTVGYALMALAYGHFIPVLHGEFLVAQLDLRFGWTKFLNASARRYIVGHFGHFIARDNLGFVIKINPLLPVEVEDFVDMSGLVAVAWRAVTKIAQRLVLRGQLFRCNR